MSDTTEPGDQPDASASDPAGELLGDDLVDQGSYQVVDPDAEELEPIEDSDGWVDEDQFSSDDSESDDSESDDSDSDDSESDDESDGDKSDTLTQIRQTKPRRRDLVDDEDQLAEAEEIAAEATSTTPVRRRGRRRNGDQDKADKPSKTRSGDSKRSADKGSKSLGDQDSDEDASEVSDSKSKGSKGSKDSKAKASKDKDSTDKDSKDKDSKDKDSKDSKAKASKDKDSKDSKDKDSKDSKDKASKDKDAKDKDAGKKRATTPRDKARAQRAVVRKRTTPAMFVRQSVGELRKVIWPTGEQLGQYFLVVLIFVVVLIAYVGGLDVFFGWALLKLFGTR